VTFDRKEYSRKYYEQEKEKILQYQKEYYRKKRKPKQKPLFEVRTGSFFLFGISAFWHFRHGGKNLNCFQLLQISYNLTNLTSLGKPFHFREN
jgi:hypothetical protein